MTHWHTENHCKISRMTFTPTAKCTAPVIYHNFIFYSCRRCLHGLVRVTVVHSTNQIPNAHATGRSDNRGTAYLEWPYSCPTSVCHLLIMHHIKGVHLFIVCMPFMSIMRNGPTNPQCNSNRYKYYDFNAVRSNNKFIKDAFKCLNTNILTFISGQVSAILWTTEMGSAKFYSKTFGRWVGYEPIFSKNLTNIVSIEVKPRCERPRIITDWDERLQKTIIKKNRRRLAKEWGNSKRTFGVDDCE